MIITTYKRQPVLFSEKMLTTVVVDCSYYLVYDPALCKNSSISVYAFHRFNFPESSVQSHAIQLAAILKIWKIRLGLNQFQGISASFVSGFIEFDLPEYPWKPNNITSGNQNTQRQTKRNWDKVYFDFSYGQDLNMCIVQTFNLFK